MKRITSILVCLLFYGFSAIAQDIQITGIVTSAEDGSALPGVSVGIKGTSIGTVTKVDGTYSIKAPSNALLEFSYVGMATQKIQIAGKTTINVSMSPEAVGLEEVVVTAMGINRDKKSLGYATQEVKGDIISTVKRDNFINSLSGEIAGIQVRGTTNIGGSTNIIIRGATSLTGNNQALFVVDGVPINNTITNTDDQSQSGAGYDYGNPASDINPQDIESINVLKGAAATALYGSRASAGIVMITTKKGSANRKGIGVTFSSNLTVGYVDKSTFPTYQKEYGAGYGMFDWQTINGKTWVAMMDDASNGPKFDPNISYYQWDAVDPESPNYNKATPWVAAKNGPITFFNNPVTYTNSIAIDNANEHGSYRFSYTNYKQDGLMPNSELNKNNFLLNTEWKVTKRLTVTGSGNYITNDATGRNSTGYNDNIMTSFREWCETNVDIKELKDAFMKTGRNATWNYTDPTDETPIYWDNPYWIRYRNYETDNRNRFLGYMAVNYNLTDWLDIYGRTSTDFYYQLQEERKDIGTVPGTFGIGTGSDGSYNRPNVGSGYLKREINSSEDNYDLMLKINKNLTSDLNLKGLLGGNIRRTDYNRTISATSGGLANAGLFALNNTVESPALPKEEASKIGVNAIYGDLSLGYKNTFFLDGTLRRDHSSTLPTDHNVYYYPSISGSFVFSELLQQSWLSYSKLRLNYAEVGSSAGFDELKDSYDIITPFNSVMNSVATTKSNPDLKPERTKSLEGGLEMNFLDNRLGFDLSLYNTRTVNQIMPISVSKTTGYNFVYINAGEIQNKGTELTLRAVPVQTSSFRWDININWARNKNKVVSLYSSNGDTVKNLQLGSFQGGVTINAEVGQPYGVIFGTDYVYLNGQKVVDPVSGDYLSSPTSNQNLGKVDPDWRGGMRNTFSYKNISLSFLIDMSKGGNIFSCDMYYGLATGLYKETAGNNDLGNPKRDPIVYVDPNDPSKGYASNSGGVINAGVNPDGKTNTTRQEVNPDANETGLLPFGYYNNPNKAFVYDASYIKLREVSLTYSLPNTLLKNIFIKGVSLSFVGSNLWIISKHIPYADPESGLGAGNLQGYSIGSLPSTRDFGFNLKLSF